MKRLLALLVMLGSLAFAQDTATISGSYYRTNEPRYENRINVVPYAKLGRAFYLGDFILNTELGEQHFDKRQFKNMVGVDVAFGFSVRYQNDDFHNETFKKGKLVVKEFNEDRYGLGYRLTINPGGVQIMNDLMYLKSSLADRRSEWNLHVNYKNIKIKHQLWYDYLNGHTSGWYEKLIVGYQMTPHTQFQVRSEWLPNKKRVDMVGLGVQF